MPLVSIHFCTMALKIIWPFIFNLICIDGQLELGGCERSAISCKSLDYVLVWSVITVASSGISVVPDLKYETC